MYQVYVILEGTFRVSFKDEDDEVHTAEVSADENKLIYLPPGAHNEVESVGDETLHLLSIKKETRVTRVDYLVGDADDAYDLGETRSMALKSTRCVEKYSRSKTGR